MSLSQINVTMAVMLTSAKHKIISGKERRQQSTQVTNLKVRKTFKMIIDEDATTKVNVITSPALVVHSAYLYQEKE